MAYRNLVDVSKIYYSYDMNVHNYKKSSGMLIALTWERRINGFIRLIIKHLYPPAI